jgi:hypothetical protein
MAKINPLTKLIQASRSGGTKRERSVAEAWDLWGADYLLATCSFFVSLPKKEKCVKDPYSKGSLCGKRGC